MFPRRLYPGQKLTATEQNELQRAVYRQGHVSGTGTNTVAVNPSGLIVRDNAPESIFGRITGAPTGSVYPFVEVVYDGAAWDDLTVWPGRSGTAASGGAKELAGSTSVPVNAIVELTPLPGGGGWGFTYGSPAPLVTGNVGDSGAQDGETTELRFDEATGVKKTNGAAPGDPAVVSLVFGTAKNIVTNVCAVLDTYGAITGIRVEYTPVTFPAGTTFGTKFCVVNPTNCVCPVTGPSCGDCGDTPPAITNPTLNFGSKTGDATCLPDSVALVRDVLSDSIQPTALVAIDATFSDTPFPRYPFWAFCDGTYSVILCAGIDCRTDAPGYKILLSIIWCVPSSFNTGISPLSDGWLSPGAGNVAFSYEFEVLVDCDAFDTPGSVVLGTITNPATFTSSVELSFSWE